MKLVEFERPDTLTSSYMYGIEKGKLVGLNRVMYNADTLRSERCDWRYAEYNLGTGQIEKLEDFYYLHDGQYCQFPQKLVFENGKRYLYSNTPNVGENNQIDLTIYENGTSKLYQQKWDEAQNRVLDIGIQHLNNEGIGFIVDSRSEPNGGRTIRYYDFQLIEDSLSKRILNSSTSKRQLNVGVFESMFDDYITAFAMYQNINVYPEAVYDSICGIDIYRFNKSTKQVDSTFIPFDVNYRFVEGAQVGNKFIYPTMWQDTSIKNRYIMSNNITMFSYDVETNELTRAKDLVLKNNVDIQGFTYDNRRNEYYIFGYSSKSKEYSASFSDLWIAKLDSNFDVLVDFTWQETEIGKMLEKVTLFEPYNDNFLIRYGSTDVTGFVQGFSFFGIVKFDLLTNINREKENPLISFYPNPAKDYLTVSNQTLPYSLKLYDLAGNIIKENNIIFNNEHQIDLTNLSTGTYVLNIGNDYFKFIKE